MPNNTSRSEGRSDRLIQPDSCITDCDDDCLATEPNLVYLNDLMETTKKLLKFLRKRQQEIAKGGALSALEVAQKKQAEAEVMRARQLLKRNMEEMMNCCDCKGFVFAIITKNGDVIAGSSENLRVWWEDMIKSAPAAIESFNALEDTASSSSAAKTDNRKSGKKISRR